MVTSGAQTTHYNSAYCSQNTSFSFHLALGGSRSVSPLSTSCYDPQGFLHSPFLKSAQTVPGTAFLLQFLVSLGLGLEAATSTTQIIIRIVKHDISPAHSPPVHRGTTVHLNIRVHMLLNMARPEASQPSSCPRGVSPPHFLCLGDCVVCHCLGYVKTKSIHPGKHLSSHPSPAPLCFPGP